MNSRMQHNQLKMNASASSPSLNLWSNAPPSPMGLSHFDLPLSASPFAMSHSPAPHSVHQQQFQQTLAFQQHQQQQQRPQRNVDTLALAIQHLFDRDPALVQQLKMIYHKAPVVVGAHTQLPAHLPGAHTETSGSSSSSSSSSGSTNGESSGSARSANAMTRYKTELFRSFQDDGTCKYGEKCQFSHGEKEMRVLQRHPKYKSEMCRTYHATSFCPYGPRCHFQHDTNTAMANQAERNNQHRTTQPSKQTSVKVNNNTPRGLQLPTAYAYSVNSMSSSSSSSATSSSSTSPLSNFGGDVFQFPSISQQQQQQQQQLYQQQQLSTINHDTRHAHNQHSNSLLTFAPTSQWASIPVQSSESEMGFGSSAPSRSLSPANSVKPNYFSHEDDDIIDILFKNCTINNAF